MIHDVWKNSPMPFGEELQSQQYSAEEISSFVKKYESVETENWKRECFFLNNKMRSQQKQRFSSAIVSNFVKRKKLHMGMWEIKI